MNERFLNRFTATLFADPLEQKTFIERILSFRPSQQALLKTKDFDLANNLSLLPPADWQSSLISRVATNSEAAKLSFHQQGYYYLLDLSSAIAASVMVDLPRNPAVILDLCAAPGGKSVFAHTHLKPELLIANEAVPKRLGALIANLSRCDIRHSRIVNNSPKTIAKELRSCCDLVIVDAPCSGQSLILKGIENHGCFNPAVINKNSVRQRFILSQAAEVVKPGGWLVYSTCTFSLEENEYLLKWFLIKHPDFAAASVPRLEVFRSRYSEHPCYRYWPTEETGVGGFSALFCRLNDTPVVHGATVLSTDLITGLSRLNLRFSLD